MNDGCQMAGGILVENGKSNGRGRSKKARLVKSAAKGE